MRSTWWYCEKQRSSTNSYPYIEIYSLKTIVIKYHTKLIINHQWNPVQVASIAFFHMMAFCIVYLLPARLSLEAFSALGGGKKKNGLTNSWLLHNLKVLAEVLSRISNTKGKHFQFCPGSAFSELPYFHCQMSFRSQLHFQLCQGEASSCCCKWVVWSSSCCLYHAEPLSWSHSIPLTREVIRAASKHLVIWIEPSQRDSAAGEAMHRRRKLVLKWGNEVWNRI